MFTRVRENVVVVVVVEAGAEVGAGSARRSVAMNSEPLLGGVHCYEMECA